MESLEEFSINKINSNSNLKSAEKTDNLNLNNIDYNNNNNKKKNRKNLIDSFEANAKKMEINDDLEIEYLKKFI
jgi:hypothetical protein